MKGLESLVIGYENISLPQNENINMGGYQRRIMRIILNMGILFAPITPIIKMK